MFALILPVVASEGNSPQVESLIQKLMDRDPKLREEAATTLAMAGPAARRAVGPLLRALEDNEQEVREAASGALTMIGFDAPEIIYSLRNKKIRLAVLAIIVDSERFVPKEALSEIAKIGRQKPQTEQDRLLMSLAIDALAKGGREGVPYLTDLLRHKHPKIQAAAAGAISDIGPEAEASIADLMVLIHSEDTIVSHRALFALASIGSKAVPYLLNTLLDPSPGVRNDSVQVLKNIDPQVLASNPLVLSRLEGLLSDPSSEVRAHSAQILGHMGPSALVSVSKLEFLSKSDPDVVVRHRASQAIKDIKGVPQRP